MPRPAERPLESILPAAGPAKRRMADENPERMILRAVLYFVLLVSGLMIAATLRESGPGDRFASIVEHSTVRIVSYLSFVLALAGLACSCRKAV